MMDTANIVLYYIIGVLVAISLAIPIAEVFRVKFSYVKFSIITIISSILIYLIAFPTVQNSYNPIYFSGSIGGVVLLDLVSYIFTIAILLGFIIGMLALPNDYRYYPYISISIMGGVGAILLSSSIDPIMVIASWTLLSITSFSIIALIRNRESFDASLRYSVVGSVATQILLIGIIISTLIAYSGDVSQSIPIPIISLFAAIFILSGVGFKIGSAPFHMWVPDVYGRATPISISILAASLKLGAIALLLRLIFSFSYEQALFPVISFMAVISMLIGSIAPLTQLNAQRIIAYSSIAHVGFILIGIAVISLGPIDDLTFKLAIAGIAFHVIAYAISKSGIFVGLNYIYRTAGSFNIGEIYRSLSPRYGSMLKFGLLLHVLNLIGVPPLPGFWGKLFLFISAARNIDPLYIVGVPWLTIIGIVASVISIYYYMNLVRPLLVVPSMSQLQVGSEAGYVDSSKAGWDLYALFISSIIALLLIIVIYRLFFIL